MKREIFYQEYYRASDSHGEAAIQGEYDAHHCLLEAKLRNVVAPSIPVHWYTSRVVVFLQGSVVELFMVFPVILKVNLTN